MAKLGQHYEAFASWRRALSRAAPENQVIVFANAVADLAPLVTNGLDKATAVDELADMAASIGIDTDQAQSIIGHTVEQITGGVEESGIDWDSIADPVTLDRLDDAPPTQHITWRSRGNGTERPRHAKQRQHQTESIVTMMELFKQPKYVITNLLQRGFVYSMTGKTGSGKTAVALFLAICVATGRKIGEVEVEQGRVLYLAGENDIDVQMRCIAMAQQMPFEPKDTPVWFLRERFDIADAVPGMVDELRAIGDFALVIVDTSAAYFQGDEVNSPTQMGEHARVLRRLTTLPGNPAVLVLCHPVKRAADDDLLPLGAGAFLNEVDGNLTITVNGTAVELYWQGKLRGEDFEPLLFELHTVGHERLVTMSGRRMTTVVARSLSDAAKEAMEQAIAGDAQLLLAQIVAHPGLSVADYAARLGWLTSTGKPHKSKTHRALTKLKAAKLVTVELDGLEATAKGKKRVQKDGGTEED